MAGLPGFDSFKDDINSCSAWSGNFGGRKKRDLGSEDEELEEVPSVMESGNGPLQWVRSLVRKARRGKARAKVRKEKEERLKREREIRKERRMATQRMVQGKEGNKKKGGKGNKGRNNQKRGRSDKKNGKKGGKKNEKKGDKTDKNDNNSSKKKGRSGKDSKLLPEFLYNQLWCFDLAMEQALERCVEGKLQ